MKLFLAACLSVTLCSAQTAGYDSIRASEMRADLTFLASDALEGRLSLQRGSEVAIEWIASEFAKAGLKPAAGDSFLQKLTLIEYRTDRQESHLLLTLNGAKQTLHFPDAYGNFQNDVTTAGPVVFAGYGITAPELRYDDYAAIDVRGKVVLVFDHEPQENDPTSIFNGTGNTRYATSRVKVLNAQKRGAIAVLLVAEPNRKHPSNQERQARIAGTAERVARLPLQSIEGDEVGIPLFTVSDKVAADLLSAAGKQPGAVQTAIDRDLHPASIAIPDSQAELHVVNHERRRATTANVAGLLEGSDPALRNETIVFSGHYDHDGPAANGQFFHGADDNASGTVGVVELARVFPKLRPSETFAAVRGICSGGARLAWVLLLCPAPFAPTRSHARRHQLRHDRPQRGGQRTDQGVDPNLERYVERAKPGRDEIQPGLSRGGGTRRPEHWPATQLQVG